MIVLIVLDSVHVICSLLVHVRFTTHQARVIHALPILCAVAARTFKESVHKTISLFIHRLTHLIDLIL